MSLGEQLRSAREGKGLTISDIARITFIRAHYLEAIERDDFSAIPPSRLRYFIQDYAKSVDLDSVRLLEELPDVPSPSVPVVTGPARSVPVPQAGESFAGVREFGDESEETVLPPTTSRREPRRKRPRYTPLDQGNPALVRGLMTVALLLLIGLGIYYLTGGFDDTGEEDSAAVTEGADTTGEGADVRILSHSENAGDTVAGDTVSTEGGDSLTLQGRATSRVWFSIRMDNRQETGELDSGQVKVWKAAKEFRVSLGNAGGLEFTLNGKPLGTLGPKGVSLRPKTIDAQGVRDISTSRPRASSSRNRAARRSTPENSDNSRLRSLEETQPRRAVDP